MFGLGFGEGEAGFRHGAALMAGGGDFVKEVAGFVEFPLFAEDGGLERNGIGIARGQFLEDAADKRLRAQIRAPGRHRSSSRSPFWIPMRWLPRRTGTSF